MKTSEIAERIIPDLEPIGIVSVHLKRYDFAKPYCVRKMVLDAACGVGYGSEYLSQSAAHVTGVDISPDAITYAKRRYQKPNVTFQVADLTNTHFPDGQFEAICSFETIEHVSDVRRYLKEMARLLSPDGVYLVSTPQVKKTNFRPENPHHTVEFSKDDFQAYLSQFFGKIELFGQRRCQSELHYQLTHMLDRFKLRFRLPKLKPIRKAFNKVLSTAAFDEMTTEDVMITKEKIDRASELIAVCQKPRKEK